MLFYFTVLRLKNGFLPKKMIRCFCRTNCCSMTIHCCNCCCSGSMMIRCYNCCCSCRTSCFRCCCCSCSKSCFRCCNCCCSYSTNCYRYYSCCFDPMNRCCCPCPKSCFRCRMMTNSCRNSNFPMNNCYCPGCLKSFPAYSYCFRGRKNFRMTTNSFRCCRSSRCSGWSLLRYSWNGCFPNLSNSCSSSCFVHCWNYGKRLTTLPSSLCLCGWCIPNCCPKRMMAGKSSLDDFARNNRCCGSGGDGGNMGGSHTMDGNSRNNTGIPIRTTSLARNSRPSSS